jgi:hypothetical protein
MTLIQVAALFMTPVGGLLVGLAACWIASRPAKHHPAK